MFTHDPVLIREVESAFISLSKREVVVDATLGLAGHTKMFLSHMSEGAQFFAFDRDDANISLAKQNLEADSKKYKNAHLFAESFENIDAHTEIQKIDAILYDLGVSSAHYDDASRGFSIREDGPLDMRFDRTH
jgi:16S rRNA (cytosine1402-N4)-methyltransferase